MLLMKPAGHTPYAVIADALDKDGLATHSYDWLLHTARGNVPMLLPDGFLIQGVNGKGTLRGTVAARNPVSWSTMSWRSEVDGYPVTNTHLRLAGRVQGIADPRILAVLVPEKTGEPAPLSVTGHFTVWADHVNAGLCDLRCRDAALLVGDACQGRGIGSELLKRLIGVARVEGVRLIWAEMLGTNMAMRRTAEACGFLFIDEAISLTTRAELRL